MLNNRQEVIDPFPAGIFPHKCESQIKEESEEKTEEKRLEKIKDEFKKFIEYIENESKCINQDFLKNYFNFLVPSALAKQLYETNYKKKNNKLVKKSKTEMEWFRRWN